MYFLLYSCHTCTLTTILNGIITLMWWNKNTIGIIVFVHMYAVM